jgi:hypothetical protein
MDTVRRYLINEGKAGAGIKKVVQMWHKEQLKLAKKFEAEIKKVVSKTDDLEGLEDYRDTELNNLQDIDDELAYAVGEVIDQRIDQLWQENIAMDR